MEKADIGVIGLAVMGANLARNFAGKKIKTLVYNRTSEKTVEFLRNYKNLCLDGETSLKSFVKKLKRPRKIILMVKAGEAVDATIQLLVPLLQKGDVIIDCGNSYYKDTERRGFELQKKGIHFVGCGVSGGEEGALNGPSLMPGGSREVWALIQPLFQAIAARDFQKKPCVTYIGAGASGHYVKMVHNGIEYGVMQLMAEAYDLLRTLYKLSPPQISKIFEKLNRGKLNAYLFEIAVKVLSQKDEYHPQKYLIDYILDKAGRKGTGAWAVDDALESGSAVSTIAMAVFARIISSDIEKRAKLSKLYAVSESGGIFGNECIEGAKKMSLEVFMSLLEKALYAAFLSTYAQGYDLISKASKEHHWGINLAEVSRIWEGGCIIRAGILNFLHKAFLKSANGQALKHLFEISEVVKDMKKTLPELRKLVSFGCESGVSVSALASSLFYFEEMVNSKHPASFIQGLRDYFGAHTYERTDRKGVFHADWSD